MDQIRETLSRLADLSEEELNSLKDSVISEFDSVSSSAESQSPTREIVASMEELANANDAISEELSNRAAEAEELSIAAEAAISRFKGDETPADESDPTDPTAEDVTESPETPGEVPDEEDKKENLSDTPVEEDTKPDPEDDAEAPETPGEAPDEEDKKEEDDKKNEFFSAEAPVESVVEPIVEAELASKETVAVEEFSAVEDTNTESSEEPVTASTNANELAFEAPEDRAVAPKAVAPVTITAGADLPGITAGSELASLSAVAQALLSRKHGMGRTSGGDGEQHTVATFSTTFPDTRMLHSNDVEGNRSKIDSVISPAAIVAAGGLTAPVETSYDIFELGETAVRPVRDALAVFGADRGGLRFMTPPVLSDLEGAVSTWTLQDDIDAATPEAPNPVKPCLRVAAGQEVTVYTDAIPLCLTFGNLSARAYPELVERHTKLGMIQHARYAETRLLTRIGALSTPVTAAAELGAARDIFVQIEQAAAAYRSRYRLDPKASLRVIFPEWFKNALRADLTKQLPGDGRDGTFKLADSEINSWFSVRNINVSWHLDGETGQIFGAQAAGALLGFPADLIWYLFSEGTFVFLDGGTLDLGLVRDSTLNGTNDYKIFLETFEGVAKVGVESLRVTSKVAIKGSSSSTTVVAG